MMIRTALHEIAHAVLHPWPDGIRPENELSRAVRETEAEGTACLVCLRFGLDVRAYSLDYIGGWLRHLSPEEAERSRARIRDAAEKLAAAIAAKLRQ